MSRLDELIQELCTDGVDCYPIKELADVGTGSSNGNEAVDDGQYPFFIRSQSVKRKNNYEYNEEAIIIPGEGGIGEIYHYVNGKYALHQRVYRIHFTKDVVDTKYAYHYFSANFKNFIMKKAVSATVKSIRKPMIQEFMLPVPPLEVQREIVRILDNFTELTARKKQYEFYRDKLLFSEEANVKNVPLGDIAKFVYGYTDKAKDTGSARFVRITDISEDGRLNPYDAKYIELTNESRKYLLQKGDLLLARTGATYGKTLYFNADEPAVYASFLIKIILDNSIIKNRYYWHFSKSSLYWEQAERYVSKGGQQQFNTNAVSRVKVPIPSLEVQDRIINVLDNFDAICSDLNIGLPAEIEARQKQYEYYRDALLTYAATGKIILDRQTDRQRDAVFFVT